MSGLEKAWGALLNYWCPFPPADRDEYTRQTRRALSHSTSGDARMTDMMNIICRDNVQFKLENLQGHTTTVQPHPDLY